MQPLANQNEIRTEQILVGPVLVPGNTAMNIEVISEKGPFRADHMIMTEDDARYFFITDIKVGRNSQFVSVGAVHASFFARRGMVDNLLFDALPRGMKMTICVQNMSEDPKTFVSVLKGELYENGTKGVYPRIQDCPFDRIVLGLGHVIVPANGNATISVQAQVVCKPDSVVIPTYVLDAMKLKSVRVAGYDVLLTALNNGEADLKVAHMLIGDWLCVDVENMTDQPKAFYGTIGGRLVR